MNKLKEQFQKYGFTEVFEVLAPQARAAIHMLPGEVQAMNKP